MSIAELPKFESGRLLMTRGVANLLIENPMGFKVVTHSLNRHFAGDCGDMCEDDVAANREAIANGDRIFSSYHTEVGKLWVITEADRSATTVLFPEEY